MGSRMLAAMLLPSLAAPAMAGSVDASYYSRMSNLPVIVPVEPDPRARLPPFKIFFVRHGDCPPGQVERYVTGSPALAIGPSRSCVSPHVR